MTTNDTLNPALVNRATIRHFEGMPTVTLPQMAEKMRQLAEVADVEFASLTAKNLQAQVRQLRQGQSSTVESARQVAEIDALYQYIVEKQEQLYRRDVRPTNNSSAN